LRVIARLNVGGPAQHVINLTKSMSSRYPTLLVAGSMTEGEVEFAQASDPSLPLMRISELGRAIKAADDIRAFFRLWKVMRAHRPDIVHTHTAKAGALGRVAAFFARVPVRIHTYHGHVFHGYFHPVLTWVVIWTERILARITTRIVVISERQRREIVEEFGIAPAHKVVVIPLGLDLNRYAVADSKHLGPAFRADVGAAGPVITTVGRLVAVKNHSMFLHAARAVLEQRPEVTFVVVGGGPLDQSLRDLAEELGIARQVRFLGWRTDLEAIYAGSDVVALTSDNEGTPVAILEALAAGTRVVATNVGGVADILDEGRLGRLSPRGDAQAFAASLLAEIDSPMEMAPAEVVQRFGIERLCRDIEQLYDDVLAKRHKGMQTKHDIFRAA
jgi:glycosyltransferase involved in cell wall biosynthesis